MSAQLEIETLRKKVEILNTDQKEETKGPDIAKLATQIIQ